MGQRVLSSLNFHDSDDVVIGLAGLAGIVGATIRLSNIASDLAAKRVRRKVAECFLFAGLLSSLLLVAAAYTGSLTRLEVVLLLIPFCLGAILFAGTIRIAPSESAENEARI